MWCVSALEMCCASSERKRVIVTVQLYHWVFTFIVFVGNGWLALVPAHLPNLRMLCLQWCDGVPVVHIEELAAAAPQLLVVKPSGFILGAPSNSPLDSDAMFRVDPANVFIRQSVLDR
jgi:hypothetical protein